MQILNWLKLLATDKHSSLVVDRLGDKIGLDNTYTSGLYYKCLMIIIYDRNDIGLYYKTRDVIDDPSLGL